jgi:predicted MPP superfamily phosphohydrolase
MAVGDNFYAGGKYDYAGVKSTTDEKWTKIWAETYKGSLANVPWYAVLGNHDCE